MVRLIQFILTLVTTSVRSRLSLQAANCALQRDGTSYGEADGATDRRSVSVCTAPSYLIRDGDGVYGERVTRRIESLGIDGVIAAPMSPWQNAYLERVIGTLRRELFDHVIVLNERHIRRLMSSYLGHYHP